VCEGVPGEDECLQSLRWQSFESRDSFMSGCIGGDDVDVHAVCEFFEWDAEGIRVDKWCVC